MMDGRAGMLVGQRDAIFVPRDAGRGPAGGAAVQAQLVAGRENAHLLMT